VVRRLIWIPHVHLQTQQQVQCLLAVPAAGGGAVRSPTTHSIPTAVLDGMSCTPFIALLSLTTMLAWLECVLHPHRFHMPAAAGDSGSHLLSAYPVVELPEMVLKTTPGLSSYAGDPAAAGASLQPLIQFAKSKVIEKIHMFWAGGGGGGGPGWGGAN
jgi:hypothetical protein